VTETSPDLGRIAPELQLLGVDTAPERIDLEELGHNERNQITDGVWIVRAGGFEAVLKVVVNRPGGDIHWQPSTVPADWNFWRRESDAYTSGVTGAFAGAGIRGPRVLQVVERSHDAHAIWLERIRGRSGHDLGEAEIEELSHRLGRAQGTWSARGAALPPWASRGFLRHYTGSKTVGRDLLDDDDAWHHPVVAAGFPDGLREGAVRLHAERAWFLAVMEQLPRTLAHLDVWPNNVIFAEDGDAVLVDWAFAGDGALGEDVGNLVPDSVFDRFIAADRLPGLAARCLDRYLDGLAAGGWAGDERLVRLGFFASAIKYDWLVPLMLARAGDEQLDYGGGGPVAASERYRERGLALLELTRWAEQARQIVRDHPSLVAPDLRLPA
jgi:hypothetical protein